MYYIILCKHPPLTNHLSLTLTPAVIALVRTTIIFGNSVDASCSVSTSHDRYAPSSEDEPMDLGVPLHVSHKPTHPLPFPEVINWVVQTTVCALN